MEKWIKIPGFENYAINPKSMEVRNNNSGRILKSYGVQSIYTLYKDKNTLVKRGAAAILFAAINGICLSNIPKKFTIIRDKENNLCVYDRSELRSAISRKIQLDRNVSEDPVKSYSEASKWCTLCAECANKGNFSRVYEYLFGWREHLCRSILKNQWEYTRKGAEELADEVISLTANGIAKGKIITSPMAYMRQTAGYMVKKMRIEHKRTITYLDNIQKYG